MENISQWPDQFELGTKKVKDPTQIVVKIKDCYRPVSYGREIIDAHVNRIAAIFDYTKLGEIVVAEVPSQHGLYEINDGNHRVQAMKKMFGEDASFSATLMPPDLTEKQRATAYKIRNKYRAPMKPVDLFRADIVMQDPDALAIKRICDNAGVGIVGLNTTSTIYPNIRGMHELHVVYRAGNLEKVLEIIRSAYDGSPRGHNRQATNTRMLRSVNRFLVLFGDNRKFSEKRLIETLKKFDSKRWVSLFEAERQYSTVGINVLIKEYNLKLFQKNRLSYPGVYEEGE